MRAFRTLALAAVFNLAALARAGERAADTPPPPQGHGVYHVSPAGSDDGPGSAERPFRTLARAAGLLQPGDTCVLHAGTYREEVRPAQSGAAGAPIRFQAAPGECPVITGADLVGGWRAQSNGVFQARVDWPIGQVFADGRALVPARFPNAATNVWTVNTLVLDPASNNCLVNALLDRPAGHWKGATLWALSRRLGWVASQSAVTDSDGPRIAYAGKREPYYGGGPGRGYLAGKRAELDAPREWHHDGTNLCLRLAGDADPAGCVVEAARRRWAFDLSGRKHVVVAGIHLFAAGINLDGAEDCTVEAVRARWPCVQRDIRGGFNRDRAVSAASDGLGIVLAGCRNIVRDSVIAYSTGDGITIFGASNTVENCVVHDCNASASDCAPVSVTGVGHVIRRCTLFNGGRSIVVHRYLIGGRIEHNHLYNAGLLSNDLGMTYTYHTDAQGTVIAHNLVHDNHGRAPGNVGIYLDDRSRNHVVHHNVVWGVSEAMAMNPPDSKGNLVLNNTLDGYNVSLGMSTSRPQDMTGSRLINNIFCNRLPRELPNAEIGTNLPHTVDARFVNRAGADYRLAAGSPAIDAGVPVAPYTDGSIGRAPDLGAFESGAAPWTAGSSIPPAEWMLDPEWRVLPGHAGPCLERE